LKEANRNPESLVALEIPAAHPEGPDATNIFPLLEPGKYVALSESKSRRPSIVVFSPLRLTADWLPTKYSAAESSSSIVKLDSADEPTPPAASVPLNTK